MALPTGPNHQPDRLKAIPTRYNGYHFRSRLEARWAVFFDALGVEYHYEAEGYELPDGTRYLPDFYLPQEDCFFEIKGPPATDEDWNKAGQLAYVTQKFVNILSGQVGDHELQFARPKRPLTPELADWLASAPPDDYLARDALTTACKRYALPERLLAKLPAIPDSWGEAYQERELVLRRPYIRCQNSEENFYALDYEPNVSRLALWRASLYEISGGLQEYTDDRYALREWFSSKGTVRTYLSRATMGPGNSHRPWADEIQTSPQYRAAVVTARSARFEHGETPR